MKKQPLLLKTFLSMATLSIDDKGIYPHILMYETQDGKTAVHAMALDPEPLYMAIKRIMDKENPVQLIVGLDRSNKEGQDIDMKYHSVLTIAYYAMGMWSIGAMPYASADEIGEIQWKNKWWNTAVGKELKTFSIIEPTINDEVIGSAYQNKISVTSIYKNDTGQHYEGFINTDNLSDKVKTFLSSHSLNINDRQAVIDVITKNLGKTFEFTEDLGFWTLRADKGLFPARSSKTKVYLEGIESIVESL